MTSALRIDHHRLQRASGEARLAVAPGPSGSRLAGLYQEGAAKIRVPRAVPGAPLEAILINTAGGLTGGDRLRWEIGIGAHARAAITTQACERLYRALGDQPAHVTTWLSLAAGARLDWLPQETILFDGSALTRNLDVDLESGATLLAVEAVVFGREAMRESVHRARFRDRWRIRRDGRLVFADDLAFTGDVAAQLARPAIAAGARAIATVGYFGDDAEARCDSIRTRLPGIAASAFDGKLIARLGAGDSYMLRKSLIPLLGLLCIGGELPKAWTL